MLPSMPFFRTPRSELIGLSSTPRTVTAVRPRPTNGTVSLALTSVPAVHIVQTRGVCGRARRARPEHDFVSRYFAPAAGIDEDPVTGSAHCCLGPYWREKLGRTELTGYQASARGGGVGVRVRGERVGLLGRAVSVSRGELL